MNVVKVLTCFFELHMSDKSIIHLLPWGAGQPVRICDSCRGDAVPPDEQGQVPVKLIRESSKMPVAPIPLDVERNLRALLRVQRADDVRAPHGLSFRRALSFVTKAREHNSFCVLHGRFIVKLCLSLFQARCHFKYS